MLSRILLAIGGLLFGVALIALVEIILAVVGVGDDAPLHDPFAGFSSSVPLFEKTVSPYGVPIYRISPARVNVRIARGPEPQREFLVEKPEREFRIFVVGGSSSQGVPYDTNYAFSAWLEHRLDAALPGFDVKVVNAGMSSYASRRIVPIVEEIAGYQPDALIVYMGHNELAEKMYYQHLLNMDPRLFRVLEWVYQTRIYALASNILDLEMFRQAPKLDLESNDNKLEMFSILEERAAGRGYPTRRELEFRDLLYEQNLRAISRIMDRAGARLILLTLSQNFADWPPPASLHREGLSASDLERWQRLDSRGRQLAAQGDCRSALEAYAEASAIDDEFADLHFRIAACHRSLGERAEALEHYRRASDLDPVPHGAPTGFNDIIRRGGREYDAILVDVDADLIEESDEGLPGDDLFTDFAHPNVRANQLIAASIARAMRTAGLPVASESWKDGYTDPPLAKLYRTEPRLEILELQSRVFVCLLAPRDACARETALLAQMDPDNSVAKQALARYPTANGHGAAKP